MGTLILGLSAYYHDSAAALVRDGEIVAAAQEERFTRKKHDAGFPAKAIEYCLREARDRAWASSTTSSSTTSRWSSSNACSKPTSRTRRAAFARFWRRCRSGSRRSCISRHAEKRTGSARRAARERPAAVAVHRAPPVARRLGVLSRARFERAAVLCLDGVGEWATTSRMAGRGQRARRRCGRSIFRTRSACCIRPSPTYTGFKVNSGEYKLMGLAPYGEPKYVELILRQPARSEGGRHVPAEHGLLQLLPPA